MGIREAVCGDWEIPAPSSGYAITTSFASGSFFSSSNSNGIPVSKQGVMLSPK